MSRPVALRWRCPECGHITNTVVGTVREDAERALQVLVRQHLDDAHPLADHANAAALSQWLADTGQLVALWGGPHDGAHLLVPPGDLPPTIGVALDPVTGLPHPLRAASARLLPHVDTYTLTPLVSGGARYSYTSQPRTPDNGWHTR